MSKIICDNTLKSCFKISNDTAVNKPVTAQKVIDSVTKKEFTIQAQPLPGKINAIKKTDPVTRETYMVLDPNAIPAFDNTFVGEYEAENGNEFIGRYNYLTGRKLVAIPKTRDDEFLGYNYKNGFYYIYNSDNHIRVYNSQGTLLNTITGEPKGVNHIINSLAINYANNQVIITTDGQPDNEGTVVYNEDLSEFIQFIPDLDWDHASYVSPADGIFTRPDGGFLQINSGLKKFNFLNANYEIEAEVFTEDFPGDQQNFEYSRSNRFLTFRGEHLYYIYLKADDTYRMARLSYNGEFDTYPLNIAQYELMPNYVIGGNGELYEASQAVETNYGMNKYGLDNSKKIILKGKELAYGVKGPVKPYISIQDELILYGSWKDFTYTINTKTGEINTVEYPPSSFHSSNVSSNGDGSLQAFPCVPFEAFI